ncbi:hypothetical protein B0H19DRAFT_8951 [Mycena capillaripes]|nr:hypothetical protein B0H19DRAFT_8951 [Mycena capillaripes]
MMLHILAFLPILSIAAHTNNSRRLHLGRQKNILDCDTPCSVLSKAVAAGGGEASTICTNALVNSQALCYGCEVKVAAITQEKARSQLDKYIAGCKVNGFAVDSFTVSQDNTGVDDSAGSDSTGDSTSTTTAPAAPTISAIPPATSRAATGGSGTTPVFSGGAPAASSLHTQPRVLHPLNQSHPIRSHRPGERRDYRPELCGQHLRWGP